MSFNPNVPNVGDFLALSQKQMLANFQAIANAWLTDHVSLTANNNVGKHNSLTLRPQGGDPTTSATQCALYNKIISSSPQLFFRSNSNATPIQLTNSNLNTIQTGASGGSQSSFLAGPFTIYMGYIISCPDNQLVTLTPSSTLLYVGVSTYLLNLDPTIGSTSTATNISGNSFRVRYNSAVITIPPIIYYMAIGQ